MIGIISTEDDLHAAGVVAQLLQRGAQVVVLDTARVPTRVQLTSRHAPGLPWQAEWVDAQLGTTDLTQLRAVWWRRPQPHELHAELRSEPDRRFAYGEVDAMVRGLWSCTDATWVNDPDRDLAASRKLWQLKVATRLGLRVPRTCVTSDPAEARAFLESEPAGAIYKPFGGSEDAWAETRLVERADLDVLDHVRFAPVIFQELVPGGRDIRVTIVGDDVHAAEIRASESAYEYDFRMDCANAPILAHELPTPVVEQLRRMMALFGLRYGAVDLRIAPDGGYTFLEINPAGQWLFVEHATGQPITQSVATLLHSLDTVDRPPVRRTSSGAVT